MMTRIPLYHLFYLTSPGLILAFLALASFFIPSESGERIGFITTLLLGMMVFLLLIPSSLPETSESIPLLGVFMMATLIIITLVLVATIVSLIMYHLEGSVPPALQRFVKLCQLRRTKKVQAIHVASSDVLAMDDERPKNASIAAIQLSESRKHSPGSNSSSVASFNGRQRTLETGDDQLTWREVSEKMDFIFFIIFVVICVITFASILA